MMQSVKGMVQAGFIAALLVAGSAFAAEPVNTTNGKPAPTQVDTSGPSQLIESAANILLADVDKNRAQYSKDPAGLYTVVYPKLCDTTTNAGALG